MSRARDVADVQDNLGGAVAPFVAGKNKIINGDFGVWQRGTTFTYTAATNYTADRFQVASGVGGTVTVSQQTFTPGTAPVAGYESSFYLRANYTASGTNVSDTGQYIEDVRTFAGQTITVSVWARVSTGTHTITPQAVQRFGTGGSSAGATNGANWTLTTDWQRFSSSIVVPSVSGKTIGAGSSCQIRFESGTSGVKAFDFWGFQAEAGSLVTPFTTATGTIQGELAACQRYYYRQGGASLYQILSYGITGSTTKSAQQIIFPVTMRTAIATLEYSTLCLQEDMLGGVIAVTNVALAGNTINAGNIEVTVASGLVQFRPSRLLTNNSTSGYIAVSAEL